MLRSALTYAIAVLAMLLLPLAGGPTRVLAQAQADVATEASPEPLTDEELEVLVARIALYPDELIGVISESSLYPLQIVEAARFLDSVKKDPKLEPKATWDGSVISLLNYPEVVRMMSRDLDWTQALAEALTYQQKEVLLAIQQLRDRAVAKGVIKSDSKVKVVKENENIIIQPASTERVYIPRYEPEMLYEPDYAYAPVTYYPDPYPHYYNPAAHYFAGVVTGVVWAAVVDWDDWGVWGGGWGNDVDIDIDCNRCIIGNNFNGKIKWKDVDWKNIDRGKIKIDRAQLNRIDRGKLKRTVKANHANSLRSKAKNLKSTRLAKNKKVSKVGDVRKSTIKGLQKRPATGKITRDKGKIGAGAKKIDRKKRPDKISKPVGKKRPMARPDRRPKKPSALGDIRHGKHTKVFSNRGGKSLGGGHFKKGGGGGKHKFKRKGGRRR